MRKFEKEGILKPKKIANIISYRLDLNNDKTSNILELALISELQGRIRYRLKDFQELKSITESCIIFGSYAKGEDIEKSDIDIAVEVIGDQELKIESIGILSAFGYRRDISVNLHLFSRDHIDINLFSNVANGIVLDGFLEVKPWL